MSMNATLFRRLPRQLKKDAVRYGALLLLVAAIVYVITATICASDATIKGIEERDRTVNLEDGEFSALVELTDSEITTLQDMGCTIEKHYSLDYDLADGSTIRIFKNRETIDLITLVSGRLAQADNEIVVERNYARKHNIIEGSALSIGGVQFTVTGIATAPDYELAQKSLTDSMDNPELFGLGFTTAGAFNALASANNSSKAMDYVYAYCLTDDLTHEKLNEQLGYIRFDVREANNEYLQEAVERGGEEALAAQEELDNLAAGSSQVAEGANQLASSMSSLESSASNLSASLAAAEANAQVRKEEVLAMAQQVKASAAEAKGYLENAIEANNTAIAVSQQSIDTIDAVIATLDPTGSDYDTIVAMLKTARTSAVQTLVYCTSQVENLENARTTIAQVSTMADELCVMITELSDTVTSLAQQGEAAMAQISGLSGGASQLATAVGELNEGINSVSGEYLNSLYAGTLTKVQEFTPAESNPRIGAAIRDERLFLRIGVIIGILGLALASYAIGVVVGHILDKEQPIIGALYALGVKRRNLLASYLAVPVTVSFAGGILGTIVGLTPLGVGVQISSIINGYSIPNITIVYPFWIILLGLLLPPIIAAIVNYFTINAKLNRAPLDLLSNRPVTARAVSGEWLNKLSFIRMFQARQILRERKSVATILVGMLISLCMVMAGVDCYLSFSNAVSAAEEDITFEYQYLLKYPPADVPEGGSATYAETLKMSNGADSHTITLLGLEEGNPYYQVTPNEGKYTLAISNAVATKFGLHVGDECVLYDNVGGLSYKFSVDQIFPYDASFVVCMTAKDMRSLFGQEEDYYNTVMSTAPLSIDTQRIYSISTHADYIECARIQLSRNAYTIGIFVAMPLVIFTLLLFLLLNVMAHNNATGISLLKIFGYKDKQLHTMYLQGNGIVVAVGALILIPLTKFIVDIVFHVALADMHLALITAMPLWGYAAIFAFVIVIYAIISLLLRSTIKSIDCDRVLRGRE